MMHRRQIASSRAKLRAAVEPCESRRLLSGRLLDINPAGDSNPNHFTAVNGVVVFNATDAAHGSEIWVTDGTSSGTQLLADLAPGPASSFAMNGDVEIGDGVVSFSTVIGGAKRYWQTDGTAAGTIEVFLPSQSGWTATSLKSYITSAADIRVGTNGALTDRLVAFTSNSAIDLSQFAGNLPVEGVLGQRDDRVWFTTRSDGVVSLCVTDGTAAGTATLKAFSLGGSTSRIDFATDWAGGLAFGAMTSDGMRLWTSDGTVSGTKQVLMWGVLHGTPSGLGNRLLFVAGPYGSLYSLDAITGSISNVVEFDVFDGTYSPTRPPELAEFNGRVHFTRTSYLHYSTDGTRAGTYRLSSVQNGSGYPVVVGGVLWIEGFHSYLVPGSRDFVRYSGIFSGGGEFEYSDGAMIGNLLIYRSDTDHEPYVFDLTQPPPMFGGQVFDDRNSNGIHDPGELGLDSNVTPNSDAFAYIDEDGDGQRDSGFETGVSIDATGRFVFPNIAPGTYLVRLDYANTHQISGLDGFNVTWTGTEDALIAFGANRNTRITFLVFEDLDGDGKRDANEGPASGAGFFMDIDADGVVDPTEPTAISDATGTVHFDHLFTGSVSIKGVPVPGTRYTGGTSSVSATYGGTKTLTDRGITLAPLPGTVSGTMPFYDRDANGALDVNESLFSGSVRYYIDYNDNGSVDTGEPSQLVSSGTWKITGVQVGAWPLRIDCLGWQKSTSTLVTVGSELDTPAGAYGIVPQPVSITPQVEGSVFIDDDWNLQPDPATPGLPPLNVTVSSNGSFVASTFTDPAGQFRLAGLGTGTRSVTISTSPFVTAFLASTFSVDVSPTIIRTISLPMRTSQTYFAQQALVFNDRNQNGVRDVDEEGAPMVGLTSDATGTLPQDHTSIRRAITDASGVARVPSSSSSATYLRPVIPAGAVATTPTSVRVTPTGSGATFGLYFGQSALPGMASGLIYTDANPNELPDPQDVPAAGQRVWLDVDDNGAIDSTEPQALTDLFGRYSFGSLTPGSHRLWFVEPNRFISVLPSTGSPLEVTAITGQNIALTDALLTRQEGKIKGVVYQDLNANGRHDPSEPPFAGISVTAYMDVDGRALVTATTNANGLFELSVTADRDIRVQTSGIMTEPSSGNAVVRVAEGGETSLKFGVEKRSTTLSGIAYIDRNRNGYRDGTIENVFEAGSSPIVTLRRDLPTPLERTATINSDTGRYSFTGVAPGHYRLFISNHSTRFEPLSPADPLGYDITIGTPAVDEPTRDLVLHYKPITILGLVKGALDEPLAGIPVFLDLNESFRHEAGEPLVLTDAQGQYQFSHDFELGSDTLIHAILPDNYVHLSDPYIYPFSTQWGTTNTMRDMVLSPVEGPRVGGTLFTDVNGNGLNDPFEGAYWNTSVKLELNPGSTLTSVEVDYAGRFVFPVTGTFRYRIDGPLFSNPSDGGWRTARVSDGVVELAPIGIISSNHGRILINDPITGITRPMPGGIAYRDTNNDYQQNLGEGTFEADVYGVFRASSYPETGVTLRAVVPSSDWVVQTNNGGDSYFIEASFTGRTGIDFILTRVARLRVLQSSLRQAQSSRVVDLTFSDPVNRTLQLGEVTITGVGGTYQPTSLTFDTTGKIASITLPDDLPRGDWHVEIARDSIEDSWGLTPATDIRFDVSILPGDVNGDRIVDFSDLLMLVQRFGTFGNTLAGGNLNLDELGAVDFDDLLLMAQWYGLSLSTGQGVAPKGLNSARSKSSPSEAGRSAQTLFADARPSSLPGRRKNDRVFS